MAHKTRAVQVEIAGDQRGATWEQGVGIWVPGHDINVGERMEIEGSTCEIRTMSRLVKQSEPWTIIKKAEEVDEDNQTPLNGWKDAPGRVPDHDQSQEPENEENDS